MSRPGYPRVGHTVEQYQWNWEQFIPEQPQGDLPPIPAHFVHSDETHSDSFLSVYVDKYGINTPGWPHHIQDNGYLAVFLKASQSKASFSTSLIGQSSHGSGDISMSALTSNWTPGDESYLDASGQIDLENALTSKLASKIKGQKINVGVMLAERRQTANLVVSTAKRLANTMLELRKGRWRNAVSMLTGTSPRLGSRVPHGVENQWLELQYGWKPLLSDVYGSVQALAERNSRLNVPVIKVKVSKTIQLPSFTKILSRVQTTWPESRATRTARMSGTAYAEFSITDDRRQVLSQTGVSNPLSVAWEVIPYSFVVDWFLPVGAYLENMDYAAGLQLHRGWLAHKRMINWKVSVIPGVFSNGSAVQSWGGGSINVDTVVATRTVFTEFPSVPIPSFKDPLSSTHVANALSLLSTAFQRKR